MLWFWLKAEDKCYYLQTSNHQWRETGSVWSMRICVSHECHTCRDIKYLYYCTKGECKACLLICICIMVYLSPKSPDPFGFTLKRVSAPCFQPVAKKYIWSTVVLNHICLITELSGSGFEGGLDISHTSRTSKKSQDLKPKSNSSADNDDELSVQYTLCCCAVSPK